MPNLCPCGSKLDFEKCCLTVHNQPAAAKTAEALMRARYSAFATGNVHFLKLSLVESKRAEFDLNGADPSRWLGLEILSTSAGQASDSTGEVEFRAFYRSQVGGHIHHERSKFVKAGECWLYQDGELFQDTQFPGRNDSCICGSEKKFKKCCWNKLA